MKLVYIAGPYMGRNYSASDIAFASRGPVTAAIDGNIGRARYAATELAANGIGFFCAHTHTAHFEQWVPDVPKEFYESLDMEMLRHCSAILMLIGWQDSKGASAEKLEAEAWGIPVFYESNPEYLADITEALRDR